MFERSRFTPLQQNGGCSHELRARSQKNDFPWKWKGVETGSRKKILWWFNNENVQNFLADLFCIFLFFKVIFQRESPWKRLPFSFGGGPGPQWSLGPSGAHVVPYGAHVTTAWWHQWPKIWNDMGANWIRIGRRYWIRERGELWLMGGMEGVHVGMKKTYRDGRYQNFRVWVLYRDWLYQEKVSKKFRESEVGWAWWRHRGSIEMDDRWEWWIWARFRDWPIRREFGSQKCVKTQVKWRILHEWGSQKSFLRFEEWKLYSFLWRISLW